MPDDPVGGPRDRVRCPWAGSAPEYLRYHDEEWGLPVRTDDGMFERLSLEAFQSGLSWLIILRKRPEFRRAFCDFRIAQVAQLGPPDIDRLLGNPGIVRNRAKIAATLTNARAALDLPEGLAAYAWSFAPGTSGRPPRTAAEVPASTDESVALARGLRQRGFRFVGPTTAYALMQATGMVDDHLADCWRRVTSATSGGRAASGQRPR